jgi:hypothetical protein
MTIRFKIHADVKMSSFMMKMFDSSGSKNNRYLLEEIKNQNLFHTNLSFTYAVELPLAYAVCTSPTFKGELSE